jgi:ABC-type bacteriocin/lantibiotic exporter with double-glycine peptidase domain
MVDRLLRIKPDSVGSYDPGSLQSRVLGISQLRQVVTSNLTPILTALLSVIFNLGYLFVFSWQLSLLVLVAGLVLAFSTYLAATKRVSYFKRLTETDGLMLSSTNDAINGIQELRAFDTVDDYFRKYANIVRPLVSSIFRATRLSDRVDVLSGSTTYSLSIFLFPLAYQLASEGTSLTTGTAIAFLTCTQTFLSSFQSAIDKSITSFVKMSTYWSRALEVIDLPSEPSLVETTPSKFDGSLSVHSLSFAFSSTNPNPPLQPARYLLKDLSFSVSAGSSLLICGPASSGKTTLLSLLSRMHDGYSGTIVVSSQDLRDVSPRIYRSHLTNVPQELLFMHGSLKSNISSGLALSDSKLSTLVTAFGLDSFVESLPMKMGTVINPSATSLPVTVKKRLLAMRGAAKSSRYVFLDDTLTGLDESEILSLLNYFKNAGSTIIATSSSSTYSKYFDQVLSL